MPCCSAPTLRRNEASRRLNGAQRARQPLDRAGNFGVEPPVDVAQLAFEMHHLGMRGAELGAELRTLARQVHLLFAQELQRRRGGDLGGGVDAARLEGLDFLQLGLALRLLGRRDDELGIDVRELLRIDGHAADLAEAVGLLEHLERGVAVVHLMAQLAEALVQPDVGASDRLALLIELPAEIGVDEIVDERRRELRILALVTHANDI